MYHKYFWGLKDRLEEIDIHKGDIIYVASDVRYLIYDLISECGLNGDQEQNDALNVLTDYIQDVVGIEGTLLFPVFSWEFCRGNGFDYFKTQGENGSYSNWILNHRKDFRRTQHPMYSFMVWGKDAEKLCNMSNQDAWGVASPFYYIMENYGKQLDFNVESYKGLTFVHCIEQWVGVPYRHPKYFFGNYTNADGRTEVRCYSMYVRDLSVDEHTKTTHQFLIENKAALQTEWNGNKLTAVDLEKCYQVLKKDITEYNGVNTLQFDNYEFNYHADQTLPYEIGKIPVNHCN